MPRPPDVPLGDVLDRADRAETPISGMSYRQLGVRLWGAGAYDRGAIDGGATTYRTLNRVEDGDVVVNKIWARHGSVAVVDGTTSGCYGSGEFPVFAPRRERLNPRWFHWYTKTHDLWSQCDQKSRGTSGKNRMNPKHFLQVTIPLPALEEQRRIVRRVEAVASRVEEARRLRTEAASEVGRALFSAYRSITADAETATMAEVAPLRRTAVAVEVGIPYFELGVRSFGRGTFHKPPIIGADLGSKRVFEIRPGDLVFNIVFAWEGAVAVVADADDGRVGSHRFLTCVPVVNVATAEFLRFHFLTRDGLSQLGTASPGGAGRNRTLSLKNLAGLRVPVPGMREQLWFNDLQEKARMLSEQSDQSDKVMEALMAATIGRAFSGEL